MSDEREPNAGADEPPIAGATVSDESFDGEKEDGEAARERSDPSVSWLRVVVGIAAAVALITAGSLFGVSRDGAGRRGPGREPFTSRDVIESSLAAAAAAESIQGVMTGGVVRGGEFRERQRVAFIIDDEGNVALELLDGSAGEPWPARLPAAGEADKWPPRTPAEPASDVSGWRFVHVAAGRYERILEPYSSPRPAPPSEAGGVDSGGATYAAAGFETAALGAGEPFCGDVDSAFPFARLRACMRQLLEGESPDMRETSIDGREAWELTTVRPGASDAARGTAPARPVTIVIDKQTRLPVRFRWPTDEDRWSELRFGDLRLDQSVPADAFTLEFPADAFVQRSSGAPPPWRRGFAPIDFDDEVLMRDRIGAVPGWPAWRPQGFSLGGATWSFVPRETGLSDRSAEVALSLVYRRGFDAFSVSAWSKPAVAPSADASYADSGLLRDDPFLGRDKLGARLLRRRAVSERLRGGAFGGSVAHLMLDSTRAPYLLPHLWVTNGAYVATVAGDLSRAEMVQVVESLGAPWMEE